ncbi:cellulose binding domain-containing protein [Streptomyces sp. NPDC090052]|uniref:glycoside hydrolase family 18 protein n=1 Tax=unclassified Streptomyces TaxID=2593676 RepID=UPI0022512877|nr:MULTISPECIES: cellulose binding domain-containing protein [unclassified Streptomyces]MCX4726429.1 cellulose binding domain-containing protein [Streptomyces sp. NBC_01306]WSV04250.1 cellulose binding domain-containing protein [Streptomyces sp. NBC_01020]WSX42313.1 cellulose binding domain-containing protein [Streptomyces sp. NBC_00963]
MSTTTHRRKVSGKTKAMGAVVAAAVAGGGAFALTGTAHAADVGAAYTKTSDWQGGYTGQYVVSNDAGKALTDWKLEFDLPAGTKLSSLWNAESTVDGQHVTVRPSKWDKTGIAAGKSLTIGFVTSSGATAGDPTGCVIDGAKCSVDTGGAPAPSGRPTKPSQPSDPSKAPQPSGKPTATASPTGSAPSKPAPTPTKTTGAGTGTSSGAGFAPYVDTSLYPAYDLLDTATKTGVKEFNLAFITSGGSCAPLWGGATGLGDDKVASQISGLRAKGGDVRVSFGGASGTELGAACTSADALAAAYGKVIDTYKLTKVDFDIEGGALPDTAANTRRAQAIAQLQKSHPGLDVSFTLPVMPEGLTQPGVDLVANAKKNGVDISAVNIMAMDYGASYSGDMGDYATQAATATQAQIKGVLGLSDAAAWKAVAVTPMIGVNDVNTEKFTVDDAKKLAEFAKAKGLGRLSMWSAARDKECAGGAKNSADPTCSSIVQDDLAFTKAFAANS